MKKIFTLLVALITISMYVFGQSPQKINYQGVARDLKGNPIANQKIHLKLEILPSIESTINEYTETQFVETNNFGLYTIQIGNGIIENGTFNTIKWETGTKFIRVNIDIKGGNDFESIGTTQLLSVPYALYADKAGIAKELAEPTKVRTGTVSSAAAHVAGDANYLSKFTALNTIGKSSVYDNGTSIGIGTSTPAATLNIKSTASTELIRMQSTSTTGFGKFTMYNDLNYATFTKYGSAATGGYAGITTQFPNASLLAFGNNGGGFLVSNAGNIGLSLFKNSTSYLKFYADYNTLNLGLGGSATPTSNVHINNTSTGDTLKITNTTTGHLATDGFEIRTVGNTVSLMNRENSTLDLGTNNSKAMTISALQNVGIGTTTPTTKFEVIGAELTTAHIASAGVDNTTGILKSEYTGTTVDDHIAIYGKSQPSLSQNYGIGLYGEGGYIGVHSFAKNTNTGSVYGALNEASSRGETYGVYGSAQLDITGNLGTKIGVMGYAKGGITNYGVYGSADTTGAFADTYAAYFDGDVAVTSNLYVLGSISKGGGTFKIDHPLDPENKYLYHSFVESPDMMNVYNGNSVTDANGVSTVQLPDYFEALNKDFRYQLTAIGGPAQVWIEQEVSNNKFVIKSSVPNAKVSWQVTGVRKDDYANAHRVKAEVEKRTEDKGKYLYPAEAGKPIEQGIEYKNILHPTIRKHK